MLSPNPDVHIYAKIESFNPSGSYKDRIALAMVNEAEKKGILKKDSIIIEPTSGNTGISLAMVSAVRGYKFIAVMPSTMSEERRNMIKSYGGELVLVDGKEEDVVNTAIDLAKKNNYIMLNQFENPANVFAAEAFAEEIIKEINAVDVFIGGIGTGGTITGTSRKLKKANPAVKIIAFYSPTEKIQGTINIETFKPKVMDLSNVDEITVGDENEAIENMEFLWSKGLFVGMSSGAVFNLAIKEAKKIKKGNIVIIFSDSGNRYLSLLKEKNKNEVK